MKNINEALQISQSKGKKTYKIAYKIFDCNFFYNIKDHNVTEHNIWLRIFIKVTEHNIQEENLQDTTCIIL